MEKIKQPELIQIPMSRLLKLELPRFAERFLELVESHNPEELQIKKMFDLLVAGTPSINNLVDRYGAHPLTKELRELQGMRTLRISEIRLYLKVVNKLDKSGVDKDLRIINNELNHFFQNLDLSKNEEMFSQRITNFLAALKTNAELATAIESLGFINLLNNLELVHRSIQSTIYNRLVSISERPQETTKELKKVVLTATKNLMKQIEIAPLVNPEIDYAPLFSELNQLLTEYKVMLNKRALYNKKKAEETDSSESAEVDVTTLNVDSEDKILPLNTDEVKEEVNEEVNLNWWEIKPVVNEKAAAMSSKTMQLPIVENNGTLKK